MLLRRLLRLSWLAALAGIVVVAPAALAGTWTSPADLSDGATLIETTDVASSSDGRNVAALWRWQSGGSWMVQATTSADGGRTWATPVNLDIASGTSHWPQIASSADGSRLVAIWIGDVGGYATVQAATATVSGGVATWSLPQDLSATGAPASIPTIAMSHDGTKLAAAWEGWNGSDNIIQARTATVAGNAATWSAAQDLSAPGGSALDPSISGSSSGSSLAVIWRRMSAGHYIVQASTATVSSNLAAWSPPQDLSLNTDQGAYPSIIMSADGSRLAACWRGQDGVDFKIRASVATVTAGVATWSGPQTISDVGGHNPSMAASSDTTRIILSWTRMSGGAKYIQTSTAEVVANLAYWQSPASVATVDSLQTPAIAASSSGTQFVLAWVSGPPGSGSVQATTGSVSAGVSTWDSASTLSSASDAQGVSVAASSDTQLATVAWAGAGASNWSTQASSLGISSNSDASDPTAVWAEFTFWLPDGRECGAISPVRVRVGTVYSLPDADANCRTKEGDRIAGWTIPTPLGFTGAGSPSLPLPPGRSVYVLDSQQFTALAQ